MKITNQSTLTSKITLPDTSEQEVTTLSSESNTEHMTQSFLKEKSAAKNFASPGDEIEQTITLTNNSDYEITDIQIQDKLSAGANFKAGSLTVDEESKPDEDPIVGFSLGKSLSKNGGKSVIKYTIKIDENTPEQTITNTAEITYTVNERIDLQESTNTVEISLINNKIVVTKTSDKSAVISGDKLTYIISIKNEGNMENKDLNLKDPLPSSVTFVENSVKINDVVTQDANPINGFALPALPVGGEIKVAFEVTIN